jgi:hypothetical protein
MQPWNQIDWEAARPTAAEVAASWQALEWEPVPVQDPAVDRFLDAVRDTHVNGGVLLRRFRATSYAPATQWFASRNRLVEYELHRVFLDHPVVRQELAELQIPTELERVPGGLKEEWSGALALDGTLAARLVHGGAYQKFTGPAHQAKAISAAAVQALIGQRYEDIRVDRSTTAWTPWFYDIAWDLTIVLTDYAHATITTLCVTDTD